MLGLAHDFCHLLGAPTDFILPALLFPFVVWYLRRLYAGYPPGPGGLPYIGAVLSMPKEKEWITYTLWKRKYGPIVDLRVLGQNIVILNTSELASELLNNRSGIYSDRPRIPMLEMMGFLEWNVGIMPLGPKHTASRRHLLQAFSPQQVHKYRGIQQKSVDVLLSGIIESPSNFLSHIRRTVTSVLLEVLFGLHLESDQCKEFAMVNEAFVAASTSAGSPVGYLVNVFPLFRFWPAFLPGGGFKKEARECRALTVKVVDLLTAQSHKKASSEPPVSLPAHFEKNDSKESMSAVHAAAVTSFSAGIETSTSVLTTFVLAMLLQPAVQRDAQTQIDQVLSGRLPNSEDRAANRLPIVDAVLKECYRWAPPGPFGMPHRLSKQDVIGEYTLPQDTIVISNMWAILHDENVYPRPMEFSPERFLNGTNEPDPRDHIFGYGKRMCPGRNLAEGTLWLGIASILAAFNITPELDKAGVPILPDAEYTSGVMSRPKDFRCIILPRSERVYEMVRQSTT